GNSGKARHQKPLAGAGGLDDEGLLPVLRLQRTIACDRHGIGGEREEPNFAGDAMGGTDAGDADAGARGAGVRPRVPGASGIRRRCARSRLSHGTPVRRPQPAAAAARSCAFFFGFAFSGLLRGDRFISPAESRKRSTRSVGVAPLASQALVFSRSSLRRSAASFATSGLKLPI